MAKRGVSKRRPLAGNPADPHGLACMKAKYLAWMETQNYTESSVRDRGFNLEKFIAWADERGFQRPGELTRPILEKFQVSLFHHRKKNDKPLSFRTQYKILMDVQMFFRWMAKKRIIINNPASELELPKREYRLPQAALTAVEAELILNQPNLNRQLGVRDRAILETFYATGIRRAELIALTVFDIDSERRTLAVRQGKGHKDRLVPLGERALAWIEKYLREVRSNLVKSLDQDVLFLTYDGYHFSKTRITQIVRNYIDRAGIEKKGSCHLFRHTMATLMLEGGADIRYIQQMLGHAELSTTEIYTHVSIGQLIKIHEATHPAATLGLGQRVGSFDDE